MSAQHDSKVPRRQFLQTAAAATAGFTIVPRHVLAGSGQLAPSDRFNVAGVGIGGMGRAEPDQPREPERRRAVRCGLGLCRRRVRRTRRRRGAGGTAAGRAAADSGRSRRPVPCTPGADARAHDRAGRKHEAAVRGLWQGARATTTTARCSRSRRTSTAWSIATPDHLHAVIALAAMDLGKHVYVQKPLSWSVDEARRLAKKAAETKVATQMGNQGHSSDDARLVNEHIWAGTIGEVREVHVWTNRPLAYWPQGIPRPEVGKTSAADLRWNMNGVMERLGTAMAGNFPVPDKLELGSVPRAGAVRPVSPGVSPVQLARLGGLGMRRHRRHGRAPDRPSVLGARPRVSDQRRDASRRPSTRRPTRWRRRRTTSSPRAATSRR